MAGSSGWAACSFCEQRQGFGFVLIGEHGGKLRGEGGVIRIFHERGAKQRFGARIVFAQDEQMREAGAGRGGVWIFVEDAAIGGSGGVELVGAFGEPGSEQRVRGRLRRELESLKQVVGGVGRIGVAIDAGQRAPGAGLECGIGNAGVESGGSDKLGTGVGGFVLAREQKAEGDMGFKGVGIGGDSAAIESSGIVETVLGVGDVARIEKGARVGGMGGEVRIEFSFGGLPVGTGDGGFGGCDFGGDGLRRWCGCGRSWPVAG